MLTMNHAMKKAILDLLPSGEVLAKNVDMEVFEAKVLSDLNQASPPVQTFYCFQSNIILMINERKSAYNNLSSYKKSQDFKILVNLNSKNAFNPKKEKIIDNNFKASFKEGEVISL